jgi:hypothetical protein
MFFLTEDATIVCKHERGRVKNEPTQDLVTIHARKVLVEKDPEGRSISGCPNIGPTIKPCTHTLKVQSGYSEWLRVEGKRVVLDTLSGYTDGTPPGIVRYKVNEAGQSFVEEVQ